MRYNKQLKKEIEKIIQLIYPPSSDIKPSNFIEEVDFYQISIRPNLSEEFLIKFSDYLYPDKVLMYQVLSSKMKRKFKELNGKTKKL